MVQQFIMSEKKDVFRPTSIKTKSVRERGTGKHDQVLKLRQFSHLDIDECKKNVSGCSQICINTIGSYHCSCKAGFDLSSDKKACQGKNTQNENLTLTLVICLITSARRLCFYLCLFVCFVCLFPCLFVCLSVCLSPGYFKMYCTDFHETLWKGWP